MAADIPVCFAGSHAQATGGTTNVVTIGSAQDGSPAFPVIAGETVIVCGGAGTNLPTGINDSQANGGYVQAAGITTSPGSWIYVSPNVAHPLHAAGSGFSADTVTVTYSGTGDGKQAVVLSVPGLTSSPVDSGSAATNSGSSNAPSVTSGALAQAREMIVAVCVSSQSAGEASWPAPWQVIAKQVQTSTGAFCSVAARRNTTGTAAVTAAPTLPHTSGTWTMSIVGLKGTALNLKSYVGASVSTNSFADKPGSWGAAQEWDADMGRSPSAQRTRVFYYGEGDTTGVTTAGNDPQGMVSLCNSHASMRPVASLKPKRMGVVTPSVATAELAGLATFVTMVRNNGVPEVRWCLWNECNYGGGTSPFGDGTGHSATSGDPWAAGGPVPPPAGGWTTQQAASHYQAYCALYAPVLLLSGYLVCYKPALAGYKSVVPFFPGRAWGAGAQANNTGGCSEVLLDWYAWDPFQDPVNKTWDLTDQLTRGTLANYNGTDYSFSPPAALGGGEIGVTNASGGTTPDDTVPGWTAKEFTNISATSFNNHILTVPGFTQQMVNRMNAGYPLAPFIWFSEKAAPAGNAIDSLGRINSRQDIGDAWRAFYDAISIDAATTGSPPSVATTSPLPSGQAGVPYSFILAASGGTAPYTWAVTTGGLPAGLALDPDGSLTGTAGTITGTPTTAQTLSVGFTVTDSAALTGSATLSITIAPGATLSVPPQTLPGGTQGAVYSTMLSASGGTSPYTWAITAGSLPAGLSLAASTGIISGTPTGTGTASFTVQVTDHAAATASRALSITVAASVFTIITSALPSGETGVSYTGQVDTAGGTLPVVSWTVTAGALPPGLSLAIAAPADPNLDDEALGNITDEAGSLITQEA